MRPEVGLPDDRPPTPPDEVEIVEQSKVMDAKADPATHVAKTPETERSVAESTQTNATPVAAREAQVTVAPPPDSRVTMASIPHVIVRMALDPEQKTQTVKLRLDPPRLGEVSIDLKLGENGLSLRIVSQTPEARDLLQQDLPRLQDLLKASGLNLQLFSASCDLAEKRSEQQNPATYERTSRPSSPSTEPDATPVAPVRRLYDTSLRINAHA
jgi:flagellar hook-length control protein FliK